MPETTCPNCGHHYYVGRGPENANWRGGEHRKGTGYIESVITPEEAALYPTTRRVSRANRPVSWVIQRSHLVWNRAHPDDLVQSGDHIHHLNRVRDDDRLENLAKLLPEDHREAHRESNRQAMLEYWDRRGRKHADRPCENCGKPLPPKQRSTAGARFCSRKCKTEFRTGKPRSGY